MSDDGGDGLGLRFWVTLLGFFLGGTIAAGILLFLFGWAWGAVGLFGALLLFSGIVLGAASIVERRQRRKRLAT